MAILSSTEITAADRRKRIRELSDITSITVDDDLLDARTESWDELAKTFFGVQHVTLTGDESYFRNLITCANLLTAIAIRQSIGGQDNITVSKEQMVLVKTIIASQNKKEENQGTFTITRTAGVDKISPRGDFS